MFMKNSNIILNKEQQEAMLAVDGAVLVTAGAGSGKTRLLTQRIYHLINDLFVPQENILAITFTNKASREMKERVEGMLDGDCKVWISTIHSMCATILRFHIDKLNSGINSHFTIYDNSDSSKLLRSVIKNTDEKEKDENGEDDSITKQVMFHISNMKNKDMDIDEYEKEIEDLPNKQDIISAIKKYQQGLIENNALDFDDLLIYTRKLLSQVQSVRDYYQQRFKYILVDEFQDTNIVQYNIIKLLAGYHKNIFVVGDEDQCIYGWRGANIANIKNFIKDYENCKVFKLEQNYRCSKNILDLANKLIQKNTERIPKTLYTENDIGSPAIFRSFDSDKDEAEFVARSILQLHNAGVEYSEIAVLMRLNALSRNFEEKLVLYNVPYAVYGGFKFFDRAEIKAMVSYLKFIYNPNDSISFEKIINYPRRGIGETTVSKILNLIDTNTNILDVLKNIYDYAEFNATAKAKVFSFYTLISDIIEKSYDLSVSEVIDYIFRHAGIKEFYADKTEENMNKVMNIQSLIANAQEFEESVDEPDIEKFLQSITLVSDIDTSDGTSDVVTLATVHAVKGLEFKVVFIVGLEQKVFPIIREDVVDEEERRLMYVALTRAKEQLYLTNASNRFMYGKTENMVPSIFLQELGFVTKNNFDALNNKIKTNKTYGIKNYGDEYEDSLTDRSFDIKNFSSKKPLSELNSSKNGFRSQKVAEKKGFDVGKKVNHAKYGIGTIISITGQGASKVVNVEFEGLGVKSLLLDFAPITLI